MKNASVMDRYNTPRKHRSLMASLYNFAYASGSTHSTSKSRSSFTKGDLLKKMPRVGIMRHLVNDFYDKERDRDPLRTASTQMTALGYRKSCICSSSGWAIRR